MPTPDALLSPPDAGQAVEVVLTSTMVRELRAHNEADPAATNHALADTVEALLREGRDAVTAVVETRPDISVAHTGDGPVEVVYPQDLVKVRCEQLAPGSMWFCAGDLNLPCIDH